jgi:multidrug efflux pump subunit AcrB
MNLSAYALKNRTLVYFLIAVLVLGGFYAFDKMSKLEDPEVRVKQALVVTVYPGASAHEVELQVTDPIEKSIRSMEGVKSVESRSLNDVSYITVELKSTIKNADIEQYWDLLRRRVADVQSKLPSGTRPSVVMDSFGDVFGMFYAVTADGYSDQELHDYTQMIKRELQDLADVSRVEVYGARSECINVELFQDKMANLGVHPAEVLSTLTTQNKAVYPGYFETGESRIRVAVDDTYGSVDDIASLIIQGHEKDQLRLSDIGRVSVGLEEPARNALRYDGTRALGIAISMQRGADITKLGTQVEERLEQIRTKRLPAGIEFHKVFFQPERVNDALQSFLVNLAESVLIVVIVLMLTMGFRSGFIIGTALVVIVLGSFLVLSFFDGTLQRVSLGALIVAMGMLVDNAIVIIDGIMVDMKRGIPKPDCLTRIGDKTAMPLLGATVIAILAFFPIFLSPDTTGIYVRDLFIVLAVSLLLSWVLALVQVPIHADRFLRVKEPKGDEKDPFDTRSYRMLRSVLSYILWHKTATVVIAVALFALSAWAFRFIPLGFFPDMSYDQLYIEYKLPEGASQDAVGRDLAEIEQYLLSQPEVTHVTTSLGGTPARYNLVRSIADPSLSYGELIVNFTSPSVMVEQIPALQTYLTDNYPQAYARIKRYNLMYKKFPIEAMFTGPDPAVLKQLAGEAMRIMNDEPTATLVTCNWDPAQPVLTVDYDQARARDVGITRADVGYSLLSATDGLPTAVFNDGVYKKNIYMKTVDANGNPIETLDNSPVWSMMPQLTNIANRQTITELASGSLQGTDLIEAVLGTVPLNQTSNGVKLEWADPVVFRFNGERAVKAQCNAASGYMTEEVRSRIASQIEAIELPEGYSLRWLGERQASNDSMHYLFMNVPIAVIMIVFILIMLFGDIKKPVIIVCCLPLMTVGIVAGMLLSGKSLGFVAIVGALGLVGMMIKNGIVLIDEINLQIASGEEPRKALLDASSSRFRPVMMASLTTVLGMIPLLSDDMFGSMAVTIMGGLLVGTLITLLFIPVLYAVFFKIK